MGVVEEEGSFGCAGRGDVKKKKKKTPGYTWEDGRLENTYVSFSKVTVALWGLSWASDAGVTEREVILPLQLVSQVRVGSI